MITFREIDYLTYIRRLSKLRYTSLEIRELVDDNTSVTYYQHPVTQEVICFEESTYNNDSADFTIIYYSF